MLMPKPHTSNNLHIKSFSAHLKKNKKNSTLKNLKKRSEAEKTLPASYRSTDTRLQEDNFSNFSLNFHAGKLANKYRVLKY